MRLWNIVFSCPLNMLFVTADSDKEGSRQSQARQNGYIYNMKSKSCQKCGAEKETAAFYKDPAQEDLCSRTCKDCHKSELSTQKPGALVSIVSAHSSSRRRIHLARPDLMLPICVTARKFARRGGMTGNLGA
jgi:RNA polymerase subunit RPABC4/transcription elongation factor Spt4